MRIINPKDIIGSRIVKIYSMNEEMEEYECNCTHIYFTVDRGFSFQLPSPGYDWTMIEIPGEAEEIPDVHWEESYSLKKTFLGREKWVKQPSKKIDIVKRIKERSIIGVYSEKEDEEFGFYEPDCTFLVLNDFSRVYCITVAPNGIGTGLFYRDDFNELPNSGEFSNFFEI